MAVGPAPLIGTLHRALQAALEAKDIKLGASVHGALIKLPGRFFGSLSLLNKLLALYGRCSQNRSAERLFDEMRERDTVTFNTMISLCGTASLPALQLYSLMRGSGMKPNNITLSVLLAASSSSASSLRLHEQIHAQAVKFQLAGDSFVGSSLINRYSRSHGLEQANRVFDRMAEVDSVSWNIMIDAYARLSSTDRTIEIFTRMRRSNSQIMDGFSLTSVLKTCSDPKYLRTGEQIHACSLKAGFLRLTPMGNALVTMYSNCEGPKNSIITAFRDIKEKNIISWTAIISGLMHNDLHEEAIVFYLEMLRMGFLENEFSFASVVPAFSGLSSLQHGRLIHGRIEKSAYGVDVAVGNALVDMYFKCGSTDDGKRVFMGMKNRDVVTWTAIIDGMGRHGKAREALLLLSEMEDEGYRPDSVTFLAGLAACSHGGLVDDGLEVFQSMTSIHGIKPKKEHYASLIDLLGRAGKLEAAERFIAEMGLDSDLLAWEALLSACRIHGDKNLGEVAAKRMMELEPEKQAPYVMLSNIYAEEKMWEEKGRLRHRFDTTGLKKSVGCSWSTTLESYTT